jgi:hypothetical protein
MSLVFTFLFSNFERSMNFERMLFKRIFFFFYKGNFLFDFLSKICFFERMLGPMLVPEDRGLLRAGQDLDEVCHPAYLLPTPRQSLSSEHNI